jgi:hypothetical protein
MKVWITHLIHARTQNSCDDEYRKLAMMRWERDGGAFKMRGSFPFFQKRDVEQVLLLL